MLESIELSRRTEAIYKNLLENYHPSVRQLITAGRAYQKALHGVSQTAKAYFDAITKVAQGANNQIGAVGDIGTALAEIANTHREIQKDVEENIKTFHTELLIPLESKIDGDNKVLQAEQKKYGQAHKMVMQPHEKACINLKKCQKKSRGKGIADPRENQYKHAVQETSIKLENFRSSGFKQALLEERKRYCLILDRVSTVMKRFSSHHNQSHDLLSHRLPEWENACKNPGTLPPPVEAMTRLGRQDSYGNTYDMRDDMSSYSGEDMGRRRKGTDANSTGSHENRMPNGRPTSSVEFTGQYHGGAMTLPREMSLPPSGGSGLSCVRALFTHVAEQDSQLSFTEGDIVVLIGEENKGWHYGENTRTDRRGWFPVSFTEKVNRAPNRSKTMMQRVRSMGDLLADESDGSDSGVSPDPRSRTMPKPYEDGYIGKSMMFHAKSTPDISQLTPGGPPPPPPPPIADNHKQPLPPPPPPSSLHPNGQPGHPQRPGGYSPASHDPNGYSRHSPYHSQHQRASPGQPRYYNNPHMSQDRQSDRSSSRGSSAMEDPYGRAGHHSSPPAADYSDEDSQKNNPFANVKLKKTATNDRSAPLVPGAR